MLLVDAFRRKVEKIYLQFASQLLLFVVFCQGYEHKKAYIAAQGPLPNTMGDFWRMVWENQCSTMVMVSECEEKGQVTFNIWLLTFDLWPLTFNIWPLTFNLWFFPVNELEVVYY